MGFPAVSLLVKPAYTAPTLEHSWVNFAAGYAAAGYVKDPFGFVHLTGVIKSGEVNNSAFTLPVGFRPATKKLYAVYGEGFVGFIQIESTGAVVPVSATDKGSCSLDVAPFIAGA